MILDITSATWVSGAHTFRMMNTTTTYMIGQILFTAINTFFLLITINTLKGQESQSPRLNIIMMLTDDQGYGDVGGHDNPHLFTPHIESIGASGIEMTQFITYPNCSASRAAILTGRYPYRTGVTAVTQVDHLMNTDEVTLAEILKENGYTTGIFGKWHLGDNHPMRPIDQGFNEALVHKGGGIGQAAGPVGNTYFDPVLEHNGVSKKYEGYCDDIFTNAAIDFIEKNKEEPFFVYIATNLPHLPLQVPDYRAQPYRDKNLHEDNARVYGMIDNIDDNVGRVLSYIRDSGIEDNTIIIFFSDNGPRHRRTKNDSYPGRWVANLRGTKTSVYDCGIRVPFYVKWPGRLPSELQVNKMGTVIDIMPTLLDACDIPLPDHINIDGRSLLPLWEGDDSAWQSKEFLVQMHYGPTPFKYMHFTVRTDQYKLVSPHDFPHGIVHQPTDDVLKNVLKNLELYDISEDPSERINMAKEHPEIVEDLLDKYDIWFDEVTEERESKGIQRIHIGTSAQPHVNLSRFDWGGPRVISRFDYGGPRVIEDNQLGYWRVQTRAGRYKVSFDLPEIHKEGTAHLRYKGVHHSQPISPGQQKITFDDVLLPDDVGNIHAILKVDRLAIGPHFVDITRLD